jgi:hypothetical protein
VKEPTVAPWSWVLRPLHSPHLSLTGHTWFSFEIQWAAFKAENPNSREWRRCSRCSPCPWWCWTIRSGPISCMAMASKSSSAEINQRGTKIDLYWFYGRSWRNLASFVFIPLRSSRACFWLCSINGLSMSLWSYDSLQYVRLSVNCIINASGESLRVWAEDQSIYI